MPNPEHVAADHNVASHSLYKELPNATEAPVWPQHMVVPSITPQPAERGAQ